MKRLGYACLTKTLDNVTSSSSLSYTNYLKNENKLQKLDEVIISNLEDLEKIIDYNIANDIHFYRLSSKIIPLATHKDVEFDYIDKYQNFYDRIGEKIKKSNMRVDFHPDQFCVLNSTNKDVVENSFRILEYHYNILEALKIEDKVIILHVGSNVFGKKQSIARFINNFEKLPSHIKECIVIENDDKVFNILDCLEISKKINTPIVLDVHHHNCNNANDNIYDLIPKIFDTWKNEKLPPKLHFSSPKNGENDRKHSDFINPHDFINFLENIKLFNTDIDIMLECKEKDLALFKLASDIKELKPEYKWVDESTFIV